MVEIGINERTSYYLREGTGLGGALLGGWARPAPKDRVKGQSTH